MHKVSVVIRDC